ncbi:MAG: alpha-hydroxy-acid oxidizing protein [Acidimicrobiia bacterium]|nr:alpha-hydroxy-acid oxidizing protein [Acidimicrobiia bacterium]
MGDQRFYALHEIVAAARASLPDGPWGYLIGGSETESTMARNRAALDSVGFRPRVLRDVSHVDTSATVLGRPVRLPVLIAPVGQLNHFVSGAAATVAAGAAEFGVAQILSSGSPPALEEVTTAAPDGLRIYQLYVTGDADWVAERIKRVQDDGWAAFCLTVDTAKYSRRERDIANRWGIRWQAKGFEGSSHLAALSWTDIGRIRGQCEIPLVLKGIATVEDAELAVEHGVDVVYVSNHGGRQLDHGLGSTAVLPEIVDAVGGRAQVFVDGGFNRGADVVKGLALGADAVGLGRLPCYGLAADGRAGLVRVLELLEDEVHRTLGLLGITTWDQLDRSYLTTTEPPVTPGPLSAFPLLG